MKIGIPTEVKNGEYRVGATPSMVKSLSASGHNVYFQKGCGNGSGFSDESYIHAGGLKLDSAKEVYSNSEMIIKVKEPVKSEYELLQEGQILYTYLHLAADLELTKVLLRKKISAIAYETIQLEDGSLPLLKPMSDIAGRMSIQQGAKILEKHYGGKGMLLGGVPGVPRSVVTIIGGGAVGFNAAKIAIGMGAQVNLVDINHKRLEYLDATFGFSVQTVYSTKENIAELVKKSDLLIGAVLIPGAKAPNLVTREMISTMTPGSVVIDVAVDQGGCIETCRPTTHANPTYEIDGVVHSCVTNIPGAVPYTSTMALTNTTSQYALLLADSGLEKALSKSSALRNGLNTYQGKLTCEPVAKSLGLTFSQASF